LATTPIRQAWQVAHRLGAVPLQTRIERLAQRARMLLPVETGTTTDEPSEASDLGLTARELEVLGQLASGSTDAQIAERLFISKKTASVHVSNLLRKLGVS